jgi:hypothetical protein
MTATGRTRRAFTVWVAATDRLERHLRLVGLKRVPKPAIDLETYLRSRAKALNSSNMTDG